MNDEITKGIIESMTVRLPKPIRIPSGHVCTVFYDTNQLTPNDMARLAAETVGHLDHDAFDIALGLAYSGILFASAVAGGRNVAILCADSCIFGADLHGKRVLIVDDVIHRGRKMKQARLRVEEEGGSVFGYACIVDRTGGALASDDCPVLSAFQTNME